jgi:hypothetical protein
LQSQYFLNCMYNLFFSLYILFDTIHSPILFLYKIFKPPNPLIFLFFPNFSTYTLIIRSIWTYHQHAHILFSKLLNIFHHNKQHYLYSHNILIFKHTFQCISNYLDMHSNQQNHLNY